MIKKILFALLAITTVYSSSFAKTTPGKHTINDEPLTWNVDIYDELKQNIPTIETREVYYMKISNNVVFESDGRVDFKSTDKTMGLSRGKQKGDFKIDGQLAKPGDIVELSYNQKLQVYVPYAEKVYVFRAKKGGKLTCEPQDMGSSTFDYKETVAKHKEFDFKGKKPIKADDSADVTPAKRTQ